jgi:tRNA A-37 threonylcarbamoyl transferase component Bud32
MAKHILYAAAPEWRAIGNAIDDLIDGPGFDRIKITARTCAGFLAHEGRAAFVKRVETGGYLKGILARLAGSRARRALHGGSILAEGGFRHPAPLLILEDRVLGSIRASYILTAPLRSAQVLSAVAIGRRRSLALRKTASQQVAREIRRLHDAGIYTRDMQETNLMIENRDGAFALYFVDFEDFRWGASVSMRRRMINLVHLDRSVGRFAPRAHRLRFFYNYLGRRPPRDEARRLVGQFAAIRARIERRSGGVARPKGIPADIVKGNCFGTGMSNIPEK